MSIMPYSFFSYKKYLCEIFPTVGEKRGKRAKLAKHLNCQTGFISQVLKGATNFSLEHCLMISDFLGHDQDETHYFMLLVQLEKSGTTVLKNYYLKQLEEILNERSLIKSRIQEEAPLDQKAYTIYYSKWYFAAVHILISIPSFQTFSMIKNKLKLESSTLSHALKFLVENSLIKDNKGTYEIGNTRIHLPKDSPHIFKHHSNWRIESIKSLEQESKDDLHYSIVFTMSKETSSRIKNKLLEFVEEIEPMYNHSKEEELCALTLDFFKY